MSVEGRTELFDEARDPERVEPSLPPHAEDAQDVRLPIDPRLDPTDQPIAVQDRQHVVAPASLLLRDVDLPDVIERVERAQELAVPDVRVERGQERDAGLGAGRPPDPADAGRGALVPVSSPSASADSAAVSRSAAARIGSSPVTTKRSPRMPVDRSPGSARPASSSSARSCDRIGPSPFVPAGILPGAVPSHSSAEPARPSRP